VTLIRPLPELFYELSRKRSGPKQACHASGSVETGPSSHGFDLANSLSGTWGLPYFEKKLIVE
jgi:hypothetical protein